MALSPMRQTLEQQSQLLKYQTIRILKLLRNVKDLFHDANAMHVRMAWLLEVLSMS